MRNYRMVVAYDGSRYKGWQRQNQTDRTIQTTLENAVEQIVGYPIEVFGSGRTDAGVHARGQVANIKVPGLLNTDFQERLNRILPEDVRVVKMELVKGGFHSRYSAKGKKYKYYIDTAERPSVFDRKYCCHYPEELDIKKMEQAAGYLLGTHDFSAFTDNKEEEKSKIRRIDSIHIQKNGTKVELEFKGSGFLYHMVRLLSGALLEVGSGKREAEEIPVILASRKRANAGLLAPARGLFLEEVYY